MFDTYLSDRQQVKLDAEMSTVIYKGRMRGTTGACPWTTSL